MPLFIIIGILILMTIGLFSRWIFYFLKKSPKKIKDNLQRGIDYQFNRAFEKNTKQTIIEENNFYNDIKIFKKNDINVNF